MKNLYFLIFFGLFLACNPEKPISQSVDLKLNWDTIRVLKNPYKGWYHHLLDNGVDGYKINDEAIFRSFPGMDHLYLRLAWSYLEPEEGKYDWHRIDQVIEKYVPLGYHISFRITSKETGNYPGSVGQELNGVQYATPVWVMKAGAKGVVSEVWNTKSWTPVWGDPIYLEKLDHFQKAFAQKYDGKEWLRYVDIGSIGEWGEGHTSFSTKIPPTVAEVKANMDVYLKNFKNSQLVVTDDLLYYGKPDTQVKELYNYAVANGISLRDDSPMVDWYMQKNLATWSVSNPEMYDPLYLKKPIVYELQHYGMVKNDGNWIGKNGEGKIEKYGVSGADVMRKSIGLLHATYIGYHGFCEEWLADNPDLTNELANRCGYWYFPVSASFSSEMKSGANEISINWLNKGIAPAYHQYDLVLRFESGVSENSFEIAPMNSNNLNWLPAIVKSEKYAFVIPSKVAKGQYILKIKLINPTKGDLALVQIGLKQGLIDSNGFAAIGKVNL